MQVLSIVRSFSQHTCTTIYQHLTITRSSTKTNYCQPLINFPIHFDMSIIYPTLPSITSTSITQADREAAITAREDSVAARELQMALMVVSVTNAFILPDESIRDFLALFDWTQVPGSQGFDCNRRYDRNVEQLFRNPHFRGPVIDGEDDSTCYYVRRADGMVEWGVGLPVFPEPATPPPAGCPRSWAYRAPTVEDEQEGDYSA